MASDQINRILEAEKEAAQIDKDARIQVDAILESARSQAIADRENTLREASDTARQLRADFHASDEKTLSSVRERAEESAKALRAKATPNMDSVVALTVDFIVGKG
jgi:vacuolar-type H+-ATPase subunit E/Vma4